MHNDEWDKQIGRRLSGFEQEPDEDSFDKIIVGVVASQRAALFRIAAASVFGLTFFVGAGFWWLDNENVTTPEVSGNTEMVDLDSVNHELVTEVPAQFSDHNEPARHSGNSGREAADKKAAEAIIERHSEPVTNSAKEATGSQADTVMHPHSSVTSKAVGSYLDFVVTSETELRGETNANQEQRGGGEDVAVVDQEVPRLMETDEAENGQKIIEAAEPLAEIIKPERQKRWGVYAEAMPFFSYNIFQVNTTDEILITDVEQVPKLSFDRLGFRGEAGIDFLLNKRTRFLSGLLVYSRRQQANLITGVVDSVVVSANSDNYALTPVFRYDTLAMTVDVLNIGLVVGGQFLIRDGRVTQWVGASAELHKGLKRNVTFEQLVSESNAAGFYTFANLFYRAEYHWRRQAILFFQPTFNYSLYMGEKLATPVNIRPYGLGASLGLRVVL
jgi:hypothetical protein